MQKMLKDKMTNIKTYTRVEAIAINVLNALNMPVTAENIEKVEAEIKPILGGTTPKQVASFDEADRIMERFNSFTECFHKEGLKCSTLSNAILKGNIVRKTGKRYRYIEVAKP